MADDIKALTARAQKRGINISKDADGVWVGSYSWEGQEYTLDNEEPEALVDDMEALVEILAQDDTYEMEYNEDLDRYIIAVEGSEEQFSDQVLAKAFASAKADVMKRAQAKEDERRKAEAAAAEKPKTRSSRKNGTPAPEPEPASGMTVGRGTSTMPDLPLPVADAVVGLLNALTRLLGQVSGPSEEGFKPASPSENFAEPAPPPPSRKRGLGRK